MNKKTLAIILAIALAVGAFAGLSFNLFAGAAELVADGNEMVTGGNAAETVGDTVFLGTQKIGHWTSTSGSTVINIGNDSVAGTDVDGNGRYFAVAKIESNGSLPTLRSAQVFTMAIDGFVAGNKYVVSAYAKLPAGSTDTVNAHLATCATYQTQAAEEDSYLTHKSEVVALTAEWQQITLIIDYNGAGDGTKGSGDKYLALVVDTPAAVDVDSISIQKMGKAPQYVADGNEMVTGGNAAETVGDTVFLGTQKIAHWTSTSGTSTVNIGNDSVAGTDADGNGRYFAVAKIDSAASNPTLRNRQAFGATIDGFEAGNKYIVSAYAKLPAGSTDTVNAHLATCATYQTQAAEADSYLTHKSKVVALTTEWQKIELIIDYNGAGDGTKGSGDKYLALVIDTPAAVDVDAISIQKMIVAQGNGVEMVTGGNAAETVGDTVFLGTQKIAHWTSTSGTSTVNIGNDSVAGTDADGNGRYFAVAKIDSAASNPTLRNRQAFGATIDGFEAGNKYIVSAYAKLPAGSTDTVKAHLATCATYQTQAAEADSYLTHKSEVVALTAEWQQITLIIDYKGAGDGTKGSGDKYLALVIDTPAAVDVDAISIQKIGAPVQDDDDDQQGGAQDKFTENLFTKHANGTFNNGADIAPLYATEKTQWAVEIVSTDSQDNDGKSALVSARGVEYAAPRAKATDIVAAYGSGKYTFTAYVKSTGADVVLQPVIQMVWGEAYNNDNVIAGTSVGKWKTGDVEIITSSKWTKITVEFEFNLTETGAKGDTLELREVLCYAKDTGFNALFAPDVLVDNISLVKEINGQENQTLIDQLGGTTNEGGNGGSNAGSSNTGDVLPVALIAVAVISAGALVVVARRKREE